MSHTPGPWEWDEPEEAWSGKLVSEALNAGGKYGAVLVSAGDYDMNGSIYVKTADANLIAAAPDLLEASTALLARVENLDDVRHTDDWDGEVVPLRAAIAKAKGEPGPYVAPRSYMKIREEGEW